MCLGSFKSEESKFKLKNVGLSKFEFLSRLNLFSAALGCESYIWQPKFRNIASACVVTYLFVFEIVALLYLCFYAKGNFVNATPLVLILGTASYYAEALQDVDDVVDAATLNAQLLCAAVEK